MNDMHDNSLEAYYDGETAFSTRAQEVIMALRHLNRATDRQLAEYLGFRDMNAVRPRITELVKLGAVEEVSSAIDHVTGRRVRLIACVIRRVQPEMEVGL